MSPMARRSGSLRDCAHSPVTSQECGPAVPPIQARSFNYATDDGLQVAPHEYYDAKKQDPQLAMGSAEKYAAPDSNPATGLQVHYPAVATSKLPPPRRRRIWIWMIIGVATIIAIAAAIAAAVIVTQKHKSDRSRSSSLVNPSSNMATSSVSSTTNAPSSSSSTAAPAPTTSNAATPSDSGLSKSGAFRGTGMATMNPRNGIDGVWLVYQDFTGDTRLVSYSLSGAWQSSESLGVKNMANASSMAATSYGPDSSVVYRLFYIDSSGTLRDMIRVNESSWGPGNIGTYNFKAAPKSSVAVFWDPTFGKNLTGGGLRVYAGGPDGLIHEYGYDQLTDVWTPGYIFPSTNGYAGCGVEFTTTLTTLHLLNADNEMELWWRNWKEGNSSYPSGSWNKGADSSSPLRTNSSVSTCFGDASAYYQDRSLNINGLPWNGFEAQERWGSPIGLNGAQGIAGTTISCGWYPTNPLEPERLHIYFQTNESNIVEYAKLQAGWAKINDIPVE